MGFLDVMAEGGEGVARVGVQAVVEAALRRAVGFAAVDEEDVHGGSGWVERSGDYSGWRWFFPSLHSLCWVTTQAPNPTCADTVQALRYFSREAVQRASRTSQ